VVVFEALGSVILSMVLAYASVRNFARNAAQGSGENHGSERDTHTNVQKDHVYACVNPGNVGSKVGIEEVRKNLIGILQELYRNSTRIRFLIVRMRNFIPRKFSSEPSMPTSDTGNVIRFLPAAFFRACGDSLTIVCINYLDPSLYMVLAQSKIGCIN
jgi:hypothetical protein